MENLDILLLTAVVSTLFIVFIGFTIKELVNADKNQKSERETGPRADLVKFMGRLFDTPVKTNADATQKLKLYNRIERTISDMESDGVYFPDEVKKELKKKRTELRCEYSGLPSVKAYENK